MPLTDAQPADPWKVEYTGNLDSDEPTPGPWEVCNDHPDRATRESMAAIRHAGAPYGPLEIAAIYLHSYPRQKANARLMAASREMLDALRGLLEKHVRLVESGDCGFWSAEKQPEVIAARAAIAKAVYVPE